MVTTLQRRQALRTLCVAVPALLSFGSCFSQGLDWPQRDIRIVVVYPVGGVSDAVARALAEKLSLRLGVPVRVENRAGLGGSVGMDALAKSAPDGYTLGFSATSPLTLAPHLTRLGYDPLRDIAPVIGVMTTPLLLVGTSAFDGTTFSELIGLGRSVRWATSGVGTTGHRLLKSIQLASRLEIVHIPYKGGGPQLVDALSGQFELLSTNMGANQLQLIRQGRLKPLAVGSPTRLMQLPDVPTFSELGFAQANLISQFGIFAPGRTPVAIVDRLNAVLNAVLRLPEIRRSLVAVDNIPTGGTSTEFMHRIAQEWESNRQLVRAGLYEGDD